jgi:hypothetical protein
VIAGIAGTISVVLIAGAVVSMQGSRPTGTPSPIPTATPVASPTLPPGVGAGLREAVAINDRLARAAVELNTALKPRRPSAAEIGPLLRKIAADVRSGPQTTARLAAWRGAGTLPSELAAFYEEVAAIAAEGLGAAMSDDKAYTRAGQLMRRAFASLPALAAATREAASRAGVDLPGPTPTPGARAGG